MAPSAKNANASNSNGDQQQPPPAKKRTIELVDVEENSGENGGAGEGFSEVQTKFKKFRKYLEEGGAYESLAKVRRFHFPPFSVETVYIKVRF